MDQPKEVDISKTFSDEEHRALRIITDVFKLGEVLVVQNAPDGTITETAVELGTIATKPAED